MTGTGQAHLSRAGKQQDQAVLPAALDALRVALTVFDAAGTLVYANAHLNYLLASLPPAATLLGKSYDTLVRLEVQGGEIAADELSGGIEAFVARRLAQLEPGQYAPGDVRLADGRVIEIKARHTGDCRVVLLWSDVTAARHQQSRLVEAVAMSADAFAFYDAQDRLVMANDLYAGLVGEPLNAILGRTFTQLVDLVACRGRILLDDVPEKWVERRLKSHSQPTAHTTIRTDTGEAYLVRDRALPAGGRAMVFTDITDKVRVEKALAEQNLALADANAQAQRQETYLADLTARLDQAALKADNAKTTFLRTMSHELKTPLNAILGFSDLMRTMAANLKPEQVEEYAALIHQGGASLLKIINQIMDLTKISAGRYELRRGRVDAGSLLWLAREDCLARAQARGLTIDADACPIGLLVHADEAVFSAMMASLLDNAVAFTPAGGAIVLSAIRRRDGVAVSVSDNGRGVAAEDLDRIMEPFEQAGRAAEHAKGAGLGLTLVKAFAELQDGRLELSCPPGGGLTATVVLPAAR